MKPFFRMIVRDRFDLGEITVTARGIRKDLGEIDCNTWNNYIAYFCIEEPHYRRKGIGKALFGKLAECMKEHGVEEIYVIPQPEPGAEGYVSKEELQSVYRSMGFELQKSNYDGSNCGNDLYVYHIK